MTSADGLTPRGLRRLIQETVQAAYGAKGKHLLPTTRHALHQIARQAERLLAEIGSLAPGLSNKNSAAQNLLKAGNLLEAVANVPEDWAGVALIFEATQHLGAARAQAGIADGPRKLTADAERWIQRIYIDRVRIGQRHGARKFLKDEFEVSGTTIDKVLKPCRAKRNNK